MYNIITFLNGVIIASICAGVAAIVYAIVVRNRHRASTQRILSVS